MQADILIMGAGPAGLNAAKAARKSGRQVVLAGDEPFPPYWRPRLPEIIRTGAPLESILIQNDDWFESAGIQFLPSTRMSAIDPGKKTVSCQDGSSIDYNSLILACGSNANIPSIPFTGVVHPLRTYEDAITIHRECLRTHKAFIVGCGILGLETAYAISQLGIHVSAYDISEYPLPYQLDREGGMFLKKRLEQEGINICAGSDIECFKEEMKNAFIIAAAGVHPSVEIARNCGIKTNRGIIVDSAMQTSIDGIYACGDMAEFSGAIPGLMAVAVAQGMTAGFNASGETSIYHAVLPSPTTKVAGISILSIGSISVTDGAQTYRKVNGDDYAMAIVSAGKITGACFVGNTVSGMKFKKWMEKGSEIDRVSSYDDIEKMLQQA